MPKNATHAAIEAGQGLELDSPLEFSEETRPASILILAQ